MSKQLYKWFPVAIVIATLAIVITVQPRFLSGENLTNVGRQFGFLAIFALAQMLPILVRGLDLSQGASIAFCSVAFALLSQTVGVGVAACATVIIGVLIGLVNGLLAIARVSPFVATLGTGSILQGLALLLSNGQPIFDVPEQFGAIAWSSLIGLPLVLVSAIVLLLLFWLVLEYLVAGRFVYAVGSNPRASELCGIPVRQTIIFVYVASSTLTSIGAVFLASRIASGNPTLGLDQTLQSIAAVVIGGVSLFGGSGRVIGVATGALFLAVLSNSLNLVNVSSYWQQVVIGSTIIFAVLFDIWRNDARTRSL